MQTTEYEPREPKKSMAIFALVLGILGFITFGILGIGAIVGIVLACVAIRRAKREPLKYGGRGIAIAALVLCIMSLVMVVPMVFVASIAIPGFVAARRVADEASAVFGLKEIAFAEARYQDSFKKFGTLEELAANNMLTPDMASGVRSGYHFSILPEQDTFEAHAIPTEYRSGVRSFFIDETSVVRGGDNSGGPASKMDQPINVDQEFPPRKTGRRTGWW